MAFAFDWPVLLSLGATIDGLINIAAYIPQIIKLVKIKDSSEYSVATWDLWLVATLLVLAYAIYMGDRLFITLQIAYVIGIGVTTFLIYLRRKKHLKKKRS